MVFIVAAGKLSMIVPRRKKKYLLLLGLINTATLLTYFICIRYTSFSVAILLFYTALAALIEPVSGIFFDYTILHTPLYLNKVIGCIFILLGAAVAVLEKSPRVFGKYFKLQV
ncbi:MAG: hypothetical protein PWP14_2377 [Methanolobus sp.]|nr:hypothetical protein [Methanolobus sp.]MDN5310983.1 hypothetical protein [Methanolobus sp.]